MEPPAPYCGYLVVQDFADQRVTELIGPGLCQLLDDECGERFVEHRAELALENAGEHVEAEHPSDHGRIRQHFVAGGGKTV